MQTLLSRRYKASHLRMLVQESGNSHSYGEKKVRIGGVGLKDRLVWFAEEILGQGRKGVERKSEKEEEAEEEEEEDEEEEKREGANNSESGGNIYYCSTYLNGLYHFVRRRAINGLLMEKDLVYLKETHGLRDTDGSSDFSSREEGEEDESIGEHDGRVCFEPV
uniref:Uncharacterized protein n=1 Tax=Vespula pensylvanica TaxID=30213 RepID=A0A834NZK2_VESPE|nr:hypothetical protein H0235_009901 [Vespula pensylvanica]